MKKIIFAIIVLLTIILHPINSISQSPCDKALSRIKKLENERKKLKEKNNDTKAKLTKFKKRYKNLKKKLIKKDIKIKKIEKINVAIEKKNKELEQKLKKTRDTLQKTRDTLVVTRDTIKIVRDTLRITRDSLVSRDNQLAIVRRELSKHVANLTIDTSFIVLGIPKGERRITCRKIDTTQLNKNIYSRDRKIRRGYKKKCLKEILISFKTNSNITQTYRLKLYFKKSEIYTNPELSPNCEWKIDINSECFKGRTGIFEVEIMRNTDKIKIMHNKFRLR